MLYRAHVAWAGFELTTLMVIGTDCIYVKIQLPYDHDNESDFKHQLKSVCLIWNVKFFLVMIMGRFTFYTVCSGSVFYN
jgi:hypothetical protein